MRKTIDSWEIWVNYGTWEHDCTEFSQFAAKENAKLYREAGYKTKIIKKRIKKDSLGENELENIQAEIEAYKDMKKRKAS